ncbi:MAG: NDP-sugar synthase [Armatimonadetes bacterium]|nr:NDP-sugar synthase [Armatimonadota bacterium]
MTVKTGVVLAGGLGTRLRPLTNLCPKPALPVVNIPLVGHQLLWLAREGIERVRVSARYGADKLAAALARHDWGLAVEVVVEPEPLDTAGAIKFAAQGIEEPFVATNGDIILNAPLQAMVEAHLAARADATILLRKVVDVSPFGLVLRDDRGLVARFLEKQPVDPTGQNTVNGGVYLLGPDVLDFIPAFQAWSVERQLFPDLLEAGRKILGFLPDGSYYWADVGHLASYLAVQRDLLDGALPWCGAGVAATAKIDASARLLGPVAVADGVVVGQGATVGPYVSLGEGAEVADGAVVGDSIVWAGGRIGPGASVRRTVVATGAQVAANANLSDGVCMPDEYSRS